MKALTLILLALSTFNLFAASEKKCSVEAQLKIDHYLNQIKNEDSRVRIVDLEFEIKKVSYHFSNCRTRLIEINKDTDRDIASL